VNADVVRVALHRGRATFGQRWAGLLALALVLGLMGGLAMASVAGARRTQSSFPAYLRSTNPSDLSMFTAYPGLTPTAYSPGVERAVARLPYVRHAADVIGFDPTSQAIDVGAGHVVPGQSPPAIEGSPNGEYFSQDRLTVVTGRMADPSREDEVVMSAGAAAAAGMHVGSAQRVAFFSVQQESSSSFSGYPHDRPQVLITLHLVGIVRDASQIVQDDDTALSNQVAVLTPALTRRLVPCCAGYTYVVLQLDGGTRHVADVAAAVSKLAPGLTQFTGQMTTAPFILKAEGAVRPESIAFGVFGLIAALATLVIGGLLAGRLVRRNADDAPVLRALGASPAMAAADLVTGVLAAILLGSALAVAVAVALSPLAPIGPVRPVYPHRGPAADWTVLGFGALLLAAFLATFSVLMARRMLPHRAALRAGPGTAAPRLVVAATAGGLPPSAVSGIRAAVGSGAGPVAPVRSALLGGVLAVLVVTASITFGASLHSLVARPALYGWNWDYALLSAFSGQEDLPGPQTTSLFDHAPTVAAWSGISFTRLALDGQTVPALATTVGATVAPPLLSGHGLEGASEVVLGPATLTALHKHIGDTVVARAGKSASPTVLRIVGTATMPALWNGGGAAGPLQMGRGAVVSKTLFSAQALNPQGSAIPGPMAVLVRMRPGTSPDAARRALAGINNQINTEDDETPAGGAVSVLRPAEIANYRAVGSTPAVLASILAAGALAALGLTLVASVRGRRREFAVFKTLGFTRGQLAASVAWQASVAAIVGVVFGVPLGIALGRQLWVLFAHGISAVPEPTVPVAAVAAVALGAVAFANLVALVPARLASRTPAALVLRNE
jgi:hypothetical protein